MSRISPAVTALAALCMAGAGALQAQNRRCQLQVLNVGRDLVSANVTPTTSNYFAGGDIRMRCRGQNVYIWADSVANYQDQVVQFIGHFRYQDETARVTSDFGTYYKDRELWEARGNVVYQSRSDASKLTGPSVDYMRPIRGTRELEEIFADQRPTLVLASRDSASRAEEPYIVVADRIRMRGKELMWAGGNVTIDRSDLNGRSDSLQLDTGKGNTGALIAKAGRASIRRVASDSFVLAGKRIDLGLSKRELTSVTGRDSATLKSKDLDLLSESIALMFVARKVAQTLAWGKALRPKALSADYEVRGDSMAVDTPAEQLKELRSFRGAWVGFKADSTRGERDWLSGDKITAVFTQRTTGTGQAKSALERIEAKESARSFYRLPGTATTGGRPTINYARADLITLTMEPGDSVKVRKVDMVGHIDGVQLQPESVRRDTLRPDSAAVRPRPRP
ncbi:MAG: hypothetical protein HOP28_08960 [Gemmatimonadales bacterium]|nr:hypothetical protein [Gemmatimonadales bacterium]